MPCLLYPEDRAKMHWDLLITLVLVVSCMTTPYRIAFGEVDEPLGWDVLSVVIDSLFLIDIIVIFNSAYYDEEFVIVENRKKIAKAYLSSWFVIDALAIVPFDIILVQDSY